MSSLNQIVYRAPGGPGGKILRAGTSFTDAGDGGRWGRSVEPWLRAGDPHGRGYLRSGDMAALIRWQDNPGSRHAWQYAHVFVAGAPTLTGRYALLVPGQPDLPGNTRRLLSQDLRLPVLDVSQVQTSGPGAAERQARSRDAIELLVPLLEHVLAGEQIVTLPWTRRSLPEAVVWGLLSILEMLGDTAPVSFLTSVSGPAPQVSGRFVSFRPGAAMPPAVPGLETAARGLATGYADGPAELGRGLRHYRLPQAPGLAERIDLLLELWPQPGLPPAAPAPAVLPPPVLVPPVLPSAVPAPASPQLVDRQPAMGGSQVICPICLTPIENWDSLPRYRWDEKLEIYVERKIPAEVTGPLRTSMEQGLTRRCPDTFNVMPDNEHHLPADYGSFGPPVILGFVGLTASGKTHLLTAMVDAMQAGLGPYGVTCRALDRALHKKFVDDRVQPLLGKSKVLPGTPEGVLTFADAFLIRPGRDKARPVVLFDVAGGDLTDADNTKKFFGIVDGVFFVVDPSQIGDGGVGDATFNNVLDLLKYNGRLEEQVSAAIVLNKADLVRFDDPVTRWLRTDGTGLDADEFLLESRDVYAYLCEKNAHRWTLPYEECAKATLHVASPTGGVGDGEGEGAVYPRGVAPRRVLRPMIAMLAMTGVLTGPEAEKVGM
jgi:hypothetical protein